MERIKQTYKKQYDIWVPWLEDKYLALFGENKSSYVAKGKTTPTIHPSFRTNA